MSKRSVCRVFLMLLSVCWAMPVWAVDSYRYLHVSIDTPWTIFIFLFFMVFTPMILAVILHWRHALKKDHVEDEEDGQ